MSFHGDMKNSLTVINQSRESRKSKNIFFLGQARDNRLNSRTFSADACGLRILMFTSSKGEDQEEEEG